jgi:hypothetical protein
MATTPKNKKAKAKDVLAKAANTLNKGASGMLKLPKGSPAAHKTQMTLMAAAVLHQPFCDDEQIPLGPATTDLNAAKATALQHHQQFQHVTDVIDSAG